MEKNQIIDRISELRTRAGISARQLSIKAGFNERYINSLESHRNYLPSIEALLEIISALDSTPAEFFYAPTIECYAKDKKLLDFIKDNKELIDLITTTSTERKALAISIMKMK